MIRTRMKGGKREMGSMSATPSFVVNCGLVPREVTNECWWQHGDRLSAMKCCSWYYRLKHVNYLLFFEFVV